jgi:predicted alpha/beta-hydrolase family hydrolase
MTERFEDLSCTPAVRGFLTRPDTPNGGSLVLTHGAGANCDSLLLSAIADALAEIGYLVLRCDLAFRQQRRFGPPRGGGAEDRESLRNAVLAMRKLVAGPIFLGGHSYGGRQASMLAAEDPAIASGLLLLSYPLHPPEKPQQLRTAHFAMLRMPAFFVHGSNDPFGTIVEMQQAIQQIAAPTRLLTVEGAGHDLSFGRRVKSSSALPQTVAGEFQAFTKTACIAA